MPGTKTKFIKLISTITLVVFLFTMGMGEAFPGISWAANPASGIGSITPLETSELEVPTDFNFDTVSLPPHLGTIEKLHNIHSDQIVIHIQDAHCNYAAQHKIAGIIRYLSNKYGINMVNLEGGSGGYDLSNFANIRDEKTREKVADYFVREGIINGAEYFAINNPDKVTLWGVENTDLYIENLDVYRNSLAYKDEVDQSLKTLTHILNALKTKIYSQELLEFDMKYTAYKAGDLEFKDYLSYLVQMAKHRLIEIKYFTNIYLLNQTLEQEKTIDFKKASMERDALIDKLQKTLSRNELEELTRKTVAFKTERISQKDFYEYLSSKAKLANVDLKDLPELRNYIIYISLYSAIDKAKVMEEIDTLENKIKDTLYQNNEQRHLSRLSKNLALMKNIFNVTLTKADYEYYRENEPAFEIRNYISFINKEAPIFKISAKLDRNIERLDRYRRAISKFYECSFKRDRAFLEKIRFSSFNTSGEGDGRKAAIIVTGGFHTENLHSLFDEEGISYVSIMPSFQDKEAYECPYFRLLAGKQSGLLEYITAEIATIAIWSYFNENTDKIYGIDKDRAQRIREAWVEVVTAFLEGEDEVVIEAPGRAIRFVISDGDARPDMYEAAEKVSEWPGDRTIWAVWEVPARAGVVAEMPTTEQLRDVLAGYRDFFDAAEFSELYVGLEKLLGEEVSFVIDKEQASYITKEKDKEREDFGYIRTTEDGKDQVVITQYFWEELQKFARERNLSERQTLEYFLGFVMDLFVARDRMGEKRISRDVDRFLFEVNNRKEDKSADARIVLASISSIFTGTVRYTFFVTEGYYEGRIRFRMHKLMNDIKLKFQNRRRVESKDVSGVEYFLDHIRLKNDIQRKRGVAGLHENDEKILDRIFDTDNPELRERTIWALSSIKPEEYDVLEERTDRASRRYSFWTVARRKLLFPSASVFAMGLGVVGLTMINGLFTISKFRYLNLLVRYLGLLPQPVFIAILAVAAVSELLLLVSYFIEEQLPWVKTFKKYNLLYFLLLGDKFKETVIGEEPEGREEFQINFDNPSDDMIVRAKDGGAVSVWQVVNDELRRLDILQMIETHVLDDILDESQRKIFMDAMHDIDTDRIGWGDVLDLLKNIRNALTEEHIKNYYLVLPEAEASAGTIKENKDMIKNYVKRYYTPPKEIPNSVEKLMEKREAIDIAIETIESRTLFEDGYVRVKIWDRNPWFDLGNSRDMMACCFLGGIAEHDIFNFIKHRSVSMLDFYNMDGIRVRAFLAASHRIVDGERQPVLLVFDVEGHEKVFINTDLNREQTDALKGGKAGTNVKELAGILERRLGDDLGYLCDDPEKLIGQLIDRIKVREHFSADNFFKEIKDMMETEFRMEIIKAEKKLNRTQKELDEARRKLEGAKMEARVEEEIGMLQKAFDKAAERDEEAKAALDKARREALEGNERERTRERIRHVRRANAKIEEASAEVAARAEEIFDVVLKEYDEKYGVKFENDDMFIQEMIERYAKGAGFRDVVYNTFVFNSRPSRFVNSVRKRKGEEEASSLRLSLLTPEGALNLETFDNPAKQGARFLLRHSFGLINMELAEGMMRGFLTDLSRKKVAEPIGPELTEEQRNDIKGYLGRGLGKVTVDDRDIPINFMATQLAASEHVMALVGKLVSDMKQEKKNVDDTISAYTVPDEVKEGIKAAIPKIRISKERKAPAEEIELTDAQKEQIINNNLKNAIRGYLVSISEEVSRKVGESISDKFRELLKGLLREKEPEEAAVLGEAAPAEAAPVIPSPKELNKTLSEILNVEGYDLRFMTGRLMAHITGLVGEIEQGRKSIEEAAEDIRDWINSQYDPARNRGKEMTAEVTQEIGEKATDKVIKPLLGITVTPAAPMAGGLMGKLTDREGNILTADFFVSEGEKMVTISHADMEDVEVPMATDVEIDQTAVLEGLRKMRVFLASPAASDISADIRTRVIDLISMFDENLILIALEHHDRVQGFFHNNRLYLNRDLAANLAVLADFLGKLGQEQVSFDRMRKEGLLMDFLGLIHELGEGFVGLPTGEEFRALTRHTFMRGAGKDARSAYDALATEVGAESMNALTPLELIERLDAKMREPGFAISRERTMRLERGESPLTDSEKALILYNAGQDAVDGLPFTGKALLFGVQDHLDPAGNARFTQDIRLITNDLRRGVLNVFLMPSPDIPGAEPGMAVVAKDARKTFRKKYGSNTRVDYYTKGEDFSRELDDLVNWAQSENEKKKGELFPKVFVYCTTPEDLRRVNDYLDTLPPDTQAQYRDMIMVGNDTEGEERAIVDEVKVIAVGAALMNDKRLADFGLSPEDLFESRKRLFNFLTTNDIIAEDISEDPAAYNKFLDDIWKGVVLLRITRVNWESIRDWKDAQDEVLRSL